MGEYATRKSDGVEIKIGTCEINYYLRLEDRNKVELLPGNAYGYFWRLPYPNEDKNKIGEETERDFETGYRLWKSVKYGHGHGYSEGFSFGKDDVPEPGKLQICHKCGLMANIPCYHGEELPQGTDDVQFFWNGMSWFFEMIYIKSLPDGTTKPVVHCRFCKKMWSFEWKDVLPYLHGEMKKRCEAYSAYGKEIEMIKDEKEVNKS